VFLLLSPELLGILYRMRKGRLVFASLFVRLSVFRSRCLKLVTEISLLLGSSDFQL
jgi:hypothetical protein